MTMIFYPHEDDITVGSIQDKLEILFEAATRYKAMVLDLAAKNVESVLDAKPVMIPREMSCAFNWQEIAKLLREIRELPEINPSSRLMKAGHLSKLAEVYEILRGAKMPKLEAVRLALVNEAAQLRAASAA